jgi:hypothetical protein
MAQDDVSIQALKVARRLDGLPAGRHYTIHLVKTTANWELMVVNPQGTAVETVRGRSRSRVHPARQNR